MAIVFGGTDLLIEAPEIRRHLNAYGHLATPIYGRNQWELADQPTASQSCLSPGLSQPNYPNFPAPRINVLHWPTGASRWATFYGLADYKRLEDITELAISTGGLTPLKLELVQDQIGGKVTNAIETNMYLLPPRALTQGDSNTFDLDEKGQPTFYLLPLVDERYFWQYASSGDLEVEDGDTWATLFSDLGTALGATISLTNTVSSDYLEANASEFTRKYQSVTALMDAAAHSVGRRIIRRLDGTVAAVDWTKSKNDLITNQAQLKLTSGGDFSEFFNAVFPASVEVAFPKSTDGIRDSKGGYYTYEKTSSVGAVNTFFGVSPWKKVIRSSAIADFTSGSGTPDNDSDLDTLAQKITDDWYQAVEKRYDYVMPGMPDWILTGYDDALEYWAGCIDANGEYTMHTHVYSPPNNFGVEEMLHSDGFEEPFFCVAAGVFMGQIDEGSGIAARSGSSVSQGTVELLDTSMAATTTTVEAYNWVQTDLNDNDIVLLQQGNGKWAGRWIITEKDCS